MPTDIFQSPPNCACVFPPFGHPYLPLPFPVPFCYIRCPCFVCCPCCQVWAPMLAHCPIHLHITQVKNALRQLYRAVLHLNVGPHFQQVSTAGHSDGPGFMVRASGKVPSSLNPLCTSILIGPPIGLSGTYFSLTTHISRCCVSDITSELRRVLVVP